MAQDIFKTFDIDPATKRVPTVIRQAARFALWTEWTECATKCDQWSIKILPLSIIPPPVCMRNDARIAILCCLCVQTDILYSTDDEPMRNVHVDVSFLLCVGMECLREHKTGNFLQTLLLHIDTDTDTDTQTYKTATDRQTGHAMTLRSIGTYLSLLLAAKRRDAGSCSLSRAVRVSVGS